MIFNTIDPKSRKIDKKLYFSIKSLTSIPFGGPIGWHCVIARCYFIGLDRVSIDVPYYLAASISTATSSMITAIPPSLTTMSLIRKAIHSFVLLFHWIGFVEVRDSRTGYLLPARDGPGPLPDGQSCWDAAVVAVAVSCQNSDPKYVIFEFYSEIPSSGPFHSIHLVKLVSKNSARAKVNDIFGLKINFLIKHPKNRPNSLTSIGLPRFHILIILR